MSDPVLCPYCRGAVPDEAAKCMHCGEWLSETAQAEAAVKAATQGSPGAPGPEGGVATGIVHRFFSSRRLDHTLNEGIKIYAGYQIVMAIVAFIVFLIFMAQMGRM